MNVLLLWGARITVTVREPADAQRIANEHEEAVVRPWACQGCPEPGPTQVSIQTSDYVPEGVAWVKVEGQYGPFARKATLPLWP